MHCYINSKFDNYAINEKNIKFQKNQIFSKFKIYGYLTKLLLINTYNYALINIFIKILKTMKYYLIILFIVLSFLCAFSQNKKLTLEDAVFGGYSWLKPDNYECIKWRNDNSFTYINNNSLWEYNIEKNKYLELLTLDELNKICIDILLFFNFPVYQWLSKDIIYIIYKNEIFFIHINNQELSLHIPIPLIAENIDLDENNLSAAYTIQNNLFLKTKEGLEIQITNNKKDTVNGQIVHRNEFGIEKGTFWSPKGNYLAFYCKDESMVTDYPYVDVTIIPAELKKDKYPMAGMNSHEVQVKIYDLKTQNITILKTGIQKNQYLTNIAWNNNETKLYITVLNRDQNHMNLNEYDIITGEFLRTNIEEKHEKYVEPLYPIVFFRKDPNKFIWQSRGDGYNHIYLFDLNGSLIKQLTKGEWEVTEFIGIDENEDNIYYLSTASSPIDQLLYCVNISSGTIKELSANKGIHIPEINNNGKYIIDQYSNINTSNCIDLIDSNGNIIKNILYANDPLKEYSIGEMNISTLKTENGIDLYYRLIKPINFDSTKKYPVIVYVYGGPHVQLIKNNWLGDADLWDFYLAQEGYIVFSVDGRGSTNRGLEFENQTFRKLGEVERFDQMQGIKFLKRLSFVDTSRIGIMGWSFGGFMTVNLMLHYPDIFKVGIAGGPVIDWNMYEVMYTERYMDTPQDNPVGYEITNLNNYVDSLKGKLLIIHGAMDNVVVWQHSLSFIEKCIDVGKQVDYFVYPTQEHHVIGKKKMHLYEKMTLYFKNSL